MTRATLHSWPPDRWDGFARALWFEHRQRNRPLEEAMARWKQESEVFAGMERRPRIALLVADGADAASMLRTLGTWHLQTWPDAPWVLIGDSERHRREREAAGLPAPVAVTPEPSARLLEAISVDWVVLAEPGDLLQPSLAGVIALASRDGGKSVAWDWIEHVERGTAFRPIRRHRAPFRDGVAELEQDHRGRAFALHASQWDSTRCGRENRLRLSIDAARPLVEWFEPLASYPAPRAHATVDRATTLDVAREHWRAPFVQGRNGPCPDRPGLALSVIVMYRDRAELTTRALASVLRQHRTGSLELVLVDNGSRPETREAIERFLRDAANDVRVRLLNDPAPFNHSRQGNLAAANATGEVLVFLNNDCELIDDDTLEVLARWAALPGIATAGPCLIDAAGHPVGGGMRARRVPGAEFNSPVEEAGIEGGISCRETIGNSFACAAIAADTYVRSGGLDPVRFPAGYNDVDFCLRAAGSGLRHVTLGRVRARHAVGSSRGRQDEIAQKLLLRQRHPWTATHACRQYQQEALDVAEMSLPLPHAVPDRVS